MQPPFLCAFTTPAPSDKAIRIPRVYGDFRNRPPGCLSFGRDTFRCAKRNMPPGGGATRVLHDYATATG